MRRTNAPAKRSSSSSRGEQSWRKSLDELTPVRFARLSARSSHWWTRFERTKRNPSAAKSCCGWMAMGNTRRRQSIVAHFNRRLTDEDDCCHEPDVRSLHRLDCPRCRRGNPSPTCPTHRQGSSEGYSAFPAGHHREAGREGCQCDGGRSDLRARSKGFTAPPYRPGVRLRPGGRIRARPRRPAGQDLQGRGYVLRAVGICAPGSPKSEQDGEDAPPRGDPAPPRRQRGHRPGEGGEVTGTSLTNGGDFTAE